MALNVVALIRSVWHSSTYKPKGEGTEALAYPKEAFKFQQQFSGRRGKKQPLLSYYFRKGGFRALFCPAAEGNSGCPLRKGVRVLSCPTPGCNTVANCFWLNGDEHRVVECNMCRAPFRLPEEGVAVYPSRAEMAHPDGAWLEAEGAPTPRIIFIVDSSAAGACQATIHRWLKKRKPPVDIDVMCPSKSSATEYRRGRTSRKPSVQHVLRRMDLDSALDTASQVLASSGGKIVFVRASSSAPTCSTLKALSRAARRAPLEYVSLAQVDEASLAPDLNPALLQEIQGGGGRFYWLPNRKGLVKFLVSRDLVPWGVQGEGRVIVSAGGRVAKVCGLGVSYVVSGEDTQFKMATLMTYSPVSLEVKVHAGEVKNTPREDRLFLQVQLKYTDLGGRKIHRIYNRDFRADNGRVHTRVTLLG